MWYGNESRFLISRLRIGIGGTVWPPMLLEESRTKFRDEVEDSVLLNKDLLCEGELLALPIDDSQVLAAEMVEDGRVKIDSAAVL
jgi:hypothetical protein